MGYKLNNESSMSYEDVKIIEELIERKIILTNYLIQVKQTKSLVGNEAIQEICTAKNYYENKFSEQFNLLTVTNNDYSSSAKILAKTNDIQLFNRNHLENLINTNDITIQEINKIESQRMTRV